MIQFKEGFLVEILFIRCLGRKDHPHTGLQLFFGHFMLESVEVEGVAEEIFVYLNHELVAFQTAEPLDPAEVGVAWAVRELTVDFVLLLI